MMYVNWVSPWDQVPDELEFVAPPPPRVVCFLIKKKRGGDMNMRLNIKI